ADVCGKPNDEATSSSTNLADPLTSSTSATTFTKIKFGINIYKKIDLTKKLVLTTGVFTGKFNDTDDLIGTANKESTNKCWSAFRGGHIKSPSPIYLGFEQYDCYGDGTEGKLYYQTNTKQASAAPAPNAALAIQPSGSKYDLLMYKEFTDPVFLAVPAATLPAPTSGYVMDTHAAGPLAAPSASKSGYGYQTDGTGATSSWQPLFLYSGLAGNVILNTSNGVLIRGDFAIFKTTHDKDSKAGFPSPLFKNDVAAADSSNVNSLWIQQQGILEIYFSKTWFMAGTLSKTSCAVSWQIGYPAELCTDSAVGAVATATTEGTASIPGYRKSFFPLKADNTAFEDFPTNPSLDATIDPISLDLRNYFIKGETIDSTSQLPSSVMPVAVVIRSRMNNIGMNHPGGKYFTINPPTLGYKKAISGIGGNSAQSVPALVCTMNVTCNLTFNLYTNCLKWASG
ncbi:MAG: hypothetical protein GY861_15400, partial [bacterium]|nr:hypothetical protein [bacterium]